MKYLHVLWVAFSKERNKTIDHCNPFKYTGM